MKINQNYLQLQDSYLFARVAQMVADAQSNSGRSIIRMDIGDVTLPLCAAAVDAMREAAGEMGRKSSFRGYGPYEGYPFLREAITAYYGGRGVALDPAEVFVSDGAKSDVAGILDIFDGQCRVLIPSPVYPVYVDTNIMTGRTVAYIEGDESNGFLPLPDKDTDADIVYLCSPNNPTGAVYDRAGLGRWVDWAVERGAVILFDAAYEAFVADPALPRSIYEIPGAKTCAIEFSSLSKTAGFTGTRCGYTVVPRDLTCGDVHLRDLWLRRQTTKFNGVSYIVQRGAAAVFTPQGQRETRYALEYYRKNAKHIADTLAKLGVWFTGGVNAPYIWLRCGEPSWDFLDRLLTQAGVSGTPGVGFGENGEHYFRMTAFGDRDDTVEAMRRFSEFWK